MWHLLLVVLVLVVVAFGLVYVVVGLANAGVFLAKTEQGWCRIVLTWGGDPRVIGPGLHWVGWPGIKTLYKRRMKFFKSVTDKDGNAQAEPHDDPDISSFKTTQYPYALPFKDEEDSHGLHLSGILAVFGVVEDYIKAFFVASDWYAEMNTRILACFRDLLAEISYDDNVVGRNTAEEQVEPTIGGRLWEALNFRPNGNPSILDEIRDVVGIRIGSVKLVSIDPPEGWRSTTLAPYKAQREKAAAVYEAEKSAILFDDTNLALEKWIATHKGATQKQIASKQDELSARALAKTGSFQKLRIEGLENANTAVVGGGAGFMVGGEQGKGGKQGKRGKSSGDNRKKGARGISGEDVRDAMEI